MLRVGLTGGIGSGKTTVAKIFEVLGIPVYYADEETKRLMNTDPVIRRNIVKEFGDRAYDDHGLDRRVHGQAGYQRIVRLARRHESIYDARKERRHLSRN